MCMKDTNRYNKFFVGLIMNPIRSVLVSYIIPVLAALAVVYGCHQSESKGKEKGHGKMFLCKQEYALCTSALCVPQPGDPKKAVCFCDVHEGPNLATVPCNHVQSSTDKHGIKTVFSTFSLRQMHEGRKAMKCPAGTPWTWCLNKRCTVDPFNHQKAICVCDVMRTNSEWTTFGGHCNTATCQTSYWSGATIAAADQGAKFLVKELGLEKNPMKWCEHPK